MSFIHHFTFVTFRTHVIHRELWPKWDANSNVDLNMMPTRVLTRMRCQLECWPKCDTNSNANLNVMSTRNMTWLGSQLELCCLKREDNSNFVYLNWMPTWTLLVKMGRQLRLYWLKWDVNSEYKKEARQKAEGQVLQFGLRFVLLSVFLIHCRECHLYSPRPSKTDLPPHNCT